jgi:hypothetical protein
VTRTATVLYFTVLYKLYAIFDLFADENGNGMMKSLLSKATMSHGCSPML